MGWGSGPWGAGPWGAGGGTSLQLIAVQPIRENVLRLTFNTAPLFNGILTPNDASSPDRFQIRAIPGTKADGTNPREVTPVFVERAAVALSLGSQLDVTIDRPFSTYPAQYIASVNQLVSSSGGLLDPLHTSFTFDGLYRFVPPPRRDNAIPSRDIANPQTREALFDPLPSTTDEVVLGSIPVGDNGDYAFDEGVTNLKKRIFRRIVTCKGGFADLPGYGVGLPDNLKRMGAQRHRLALAAETESQLKQEPGVEDVSARVVTDSVNPGLFRLRIQVKATFSDDPIDMDVPFSPT
tara:strand:- start:466 stop:1347 length:882 start_codon:yes stop_codon:yes gene_type:complete